MPISGFSRKRPIRNLESGISDGSPTSSRIRRSHFLPRFRNATSVSQAADAWSDSSTSTNPSVQAVSPSAMSSSVPNNSRIKSHGDGITPNRRQHQSRSLGPVHSGRESDLDNSSTPRDRRSYIGFSKRYRGSKNRTGSESSPRNGSLTTLETRSKAMDECENEEDETPPALKDVFRLVSMSTEESDERSACSRALFQSLIKIENSEL